jgi:GTP-binding protein
MIMGNYLAIVGRPNVGKSTLFNRLTKSRQAIVQETSGVTRDRHYGHSYWNGVEFIVIDTGGYVMGSEDIFEEEIRRQVDLAIDEADIILFMVDVKDGITPLDEDVAEMLRKSRKAIFLVSNKVDNTAMYINSSEFYSLGLGEVYSISAINGAGTGDLLDVVVKEFKDDEPIDRKDDIPRFTVVGRPNVGKSSLINALLGDERNIVTDIAGTTRDTIYTEYNRFGFSFKLVDTAGIRKKAKVHEDIEFYSVLRSLRAIENSDVCVLMIDAQNGIEAQDLNILGIIQQNNKGVVIVVNKWDLIEKESNTHKEFEQQIRERTAPFTDIPIVFTSVINKQRIHKTLEIIHQVYENRTRKITTSKLNEKLLPLIEAVPPPMASRERYIRIKYVTQLKTHYPSFAFFCNLPKEVKDPYARFLENQIRKSYNFNGVPIRLHFREK